MQSNYHREPVIWKIRLASHTYSVAGRRHAGSIAKTVTELHIENEQDASAENDGRRDDERSGGHTESRVNGAGPGCAGIGAGRRLDATAEAHSRWSPRAAKLHPRSYRR